MKILNLLLLLFIIVGVYCSSQNHTPTNILNQLLAAVNELCIHQPNDCGPATYIYEPNNPVSVNIGLDELNNHIRGTIYDIIPELRRLSKEEANTFFKEELFPLIKEIIVKLGVDSIDKNIITDDDANVIVESIRTNLRNKDIIAELLNSNGDINESPSLFSDNYIKKLYIYSKSGATNSGRYINEILKYMKDGTDEFPDNVGNSNYSNLEHLGDTSYINEPLDIINKEDLKNIFKLCREDALCKSYFVRHNNDKLINFNIFKSIINGIERYHLLINDGDKLTTAHPITVIKTIVNNGDDEYKIDENFAPKEVYFYKPLSIFDNNNNDLNNHATSFTQLFTGANSYSNTNIFLNYLNKCEQIRGSSNFDNLSRDEKKSN